LLEGGLEDKAQTWVRILEVLGDILKCAGTAVGFEGADAGGGRQDDVVDAKDVRGCREAPPTVFSAGLTPAEAPSATVLENFIGLLGVSSVGCVDGLVDFRRIAVVLAGSDLSETIDSKTAFFGLPLFLTTSADIFSVLMRS
jgi:hypothetical protein